MSPFIRMAAGVALNAVPFALLFLALRRSNKQHSARLGTVINIVRQDCEAGAQDRRQLASLTAVLCRTSGDLCAVQDRLDRMVHAAA